LTLNCKEYRKLPEQECLRFLVAHFVLPSLPQQKRLECLHPRKKPEHWSLAYKKLTPTFSEILPHAQTKPKLLEKAVKNAVKFMVIWLVELTLLVNAKPNTMNSSRQYTQPSDFHSLMLSWTKARLAIMKKTKLVGV